MKGKIKENANVAELLKDAQRCKGEVLITTDEGDCLNLKSTLSQWVLVTLAGQPEVLKMGQLNFEEEDREILKYYLA